MSVTVSQECVSLNRDGADGSDEGQTACGTNEAIPGEAESSRKNEDLSDNELREYDLENYDEEEYAGKKKLNVRYLSEEPFHFLLYLRH